MTLLDMHIDFIMTNEHTLTPNLQETTITVQETQPETSTQSNEELVLRLQPVDPPPRVTWREDTVDNEYMGKKKSKCCCIYKKPKKWDDPDTDGSDSDCETGHCRGHVEKKRHDDHDSNPGHSGGSPPASNNS
uniref:E3 ubiquitin-protein ligase PPP1R11 n=1 Tax=Acrobeloides nanus TaxID=290746 RepID=A0A914DSY4_9BILA